MINNSIAYSLLFSIAKGDVFGKDQVNDLVLLDIPVMMGVLEGVVMELQDCAIPVLRGEQVAFQDLNVAILVGSMPQEGRHGEDGPAQTPTWPSLRVLVVGNPATTNCLIAAKSALPFLKRTSPA
uniref:Malate dehydrogenase n=1 Tax=Gouania willdenowi TaxID=441366 RepID=A0A8C5HPJ9_GOUWI